MADDALDDEALLEELEEALIQERHNQEAAIKAATTMTITPPRQAASSSANTPNTPSTPLSTASSGRSAVRQSSLLPPGSILRRNSTPVSADSPNSTLKHEPQTQNQTQNQTQTNHITSPNVRGTPSVPTKTAVSSAASKGPKSTPPTQPIIAAAAAAKTGVRSRPASGQNAASSTATATATASSSSSSSSATGIGRARFDSNAVADLSVGNVAASAQTPLLGRTRSVDGNRSGLPSQAGGTPGAGSALKRASSKSVVVPSSQPASTRTTLRSPVTTSRAADSQNMVVWVQRNLGGIDDEILHDAGLHSLGSNDGKDKSNGNSTELVKCLTHIALKLNEKCKNGASENGRIIEENEYLRRRTELMAAESQNQQEIHEEMMRNMRSEIESISRRVNHELTLFRQEMELQEANSSRARRALQQKLDEAEEKVIQLKKENEAISRTNP